MNDDLEQLAEWAAPLIRRLEPRERRAMNRELARHLRKDQQQRIAAQKNPDGSRFAPKKPQRRNRKGAIHRKAMFRKLRTARYLRIGSDADHALTGFRRRAATIARVHQYGERARVEKDGPLVDYPRRQLLGFTATSREEIADFILESLTPPRRTR